MMMDPTMGPKLLSLSIGLVMNHFYSGIVEIVFSSTIAQSFFVGILVLRFISRQTSFSIRS